MRIPRETHRFKQFPSEQSANASDGHTSLVKWLLRSSPYDNDNFVVPPPKVLIWAIHRSWEWSPKIQAIKSVCCYCNNPCSGAHQCWKCSKPCHAIAPCSFSHDGEEGFGSKVTCCVCWLDDGFEVDQSASAVVSTEPISNNNDEALSQFINEQIVTEENNNNINDGVEWALQTKRKRRAYSIQEKVEIIDFTKKSSIHAASRHFGVDRNTVRDWKKQEANLRKEAESSKRKRLEGGGRKVPNMNFEEAMFQWVSELRQKKVRVTRNMIIAQAIKMSADYENMENFSAAPDVCWNAPFKEAIRKMYNDWMAHGEKATTSGGNLKAPPMEVYLDWIANAWDSLPKQMIADSFLTCGISKEEKGRHDDKIHVFKPDGAIPNGLALLKQRRQEEEVLKMVEEIDLGEDEREVS
ncbi:hypothetical protein niasHS_016647 [Heterodera schachtii]|uniref:Uncharacterized protein n=1 Tax=Heterodera schachtii TaxID=97005 RepID=A0ABD2I0A7_HETSC